MLGAYNIPLGAFQLGQGPYAEVVAEVDTALHLIATYSGSVALIGSYAGTLAVVASQSPALSLSAAVSDDVEADGSSEPALALTGSTN